MLKQQTAAARNFRAAEFEFGCIQAQRNGILPPPSERAASSMAGTPTSSITHAPDEYESYMQANPCVYHDICMCSLPNRISYASSVTPASRVTVARPSLPTIKSERSASPPGLSAANGPYEGPCEGPDEEGVALPPELIEARTRSSSPGARTKASLGAFVAKTGTDSE
jgi:hypothetical protein